jgi:hypothetical protein
MAGGPTLNQLVNIGEINIEDCICFKKKCKGCVQWELSGCENCFRPAYSEDECEKCQKED